MHVSIRSCLSAFPKSYTVRALFMVGRLTPNRVPNQSCMHIQFIHQLCTGNVRFAQNRNIKPKYSFETVDYLIDNQIDINIIEKSFPSLLHRDINHVRDNLVCLSDIGLDSKDLIQVIESSPHILALENSKLKDIIAYWQSCGFEGNVLTRMVVKKSSILLHDLRKEIKMKLNYLTSLVGESERVIHLAKLQPSLFTFEIPEAERKIQWLTDLGFGKLGIAIIVYRLPSFLLKDFQDLRCPIDWLRSLNCTNIDIKRIALEYPGIFGRSINILRNIEEFFHTIGCDKQQFKSIILKFPTLLSRSVQSMQNRLEFVADSVNFNTDEVKDTPILFTCEFDKIKIRYQFLQYVNMTDPFPLKQLILASDGRFAKEHAKSSHGKYKEFLQTILI